MIAAVEVLRLPRRPLVRALGARGVLLLERFVAAVVRHALVKCAPLGASTTPCVMRRLMSCVCTGPFDARSSVGTSCSTLMKHVGAAERDEVVHVGVDVEVLPVAASRRRGACG